ncbi:MAG: hypothetical protein ACXIUL_03115 [Wenzhouxiangella sp.]
MFKKSMFALATVFAVTGCGQDSGSDSSIDAPSATTAVSPASAEIRDRLFERIDADTVYLFANLSPLDQGLADRIWQSMEGFADDQAAVYGELAEDLNEDSPWLAALMRELGGISSEQAMRERGLAPNGFWAVHAIDWLPAGHWQLDDRGAFEQMLDRLTEDAGSEPPRLAFGDHSLIWLPLEESGLFVALHHDDHFVTLALTTGDESQLARLVGDERPSLPLAASTLEQFNRERGFTPFGSGFVDFERMLASLMVSESNGAGPAGDVRSLLDEHEACRSELTALTRQLPRLSMGISHASQDGMTGRLRVETASALAERLMPIADTPVSLDVSNPTLLNMGLAFNLVAARDFGRELVGGWVSQPPECPLFEDIAAQAGDWQRALNQPIPPFITNIHGFRLNLTSLAMDSSGPIDGEGTLAVFMRNPQMLIGMAQMFSPELAGMNLSPGGEPEPLPAGMIPNLPELAAFMAMGREAIGLAVGEGQREPLKAALEPGDRDRAIMAYSINMAAYGELLQNMLESAPTEMENPLADMGWFTSYSEFYRETSFRLELNEGGIDMISHVQFGD